MKEREIAMTNVRKSLDHQVLVNEMNLGVALKSIDRSRATIFE